MISHITIRPQRLAIVVLFSDRDTPDLPPHKRLQREDMLPQRRYEVDRARENV
jgi:hypothetical protein